MVALPFHGLAAWTGLLSETATSTCESRVLPVGPGSKDTFPCGRLEPSVLGHLSSLSHSAWFCSVDGTLPEDWDSLSLTPRGPPSVS